MANRKEFEIDPELLKEFLEQQQSKDKEAKAEEAPEEVAEETVEAEVADTEEDAEELEAVEDADEEESDGDVTEVSDDDSDEEESEEELEGVEFEEAILTGAEDRNELTYGSFKGYLLFDRKVKSLDDLVDGIENLWGDELEQSQIQKKKVRAVVNGQRITLKVVKKPKRWLYKAIAEEGLCCDSYEQVVKVEVEPLMDWNYDEDGAYVYDEDALYWCYDMYAKIVLAGLAIPGAVGIASVVGKKEVLAFTEGDALSYGLWDLVGAYRPGFDAFSLVTKVETAEKDGVAMGVLRGLESWFGGVPIECVEEGYSEEEVYNALALVPSFLDLEDVWSGVDYHMFEGENKKKGIYDVYLRYDEEGLLLEGPVYRVEFEAL